MWGVDESGVRMPMSPWIWQDATDIESGAVGLLAFTSQRREVDARRIGLVGLQGKTKLILKIANRDTLMAVFPTEEAAVAARAAGGTDTSHVRLM